MALKKCFECGTEVSEYAEKCPTCGCPMSVIKEQESKPKNSNPYVVVFCDGESIDLTGLEDRITEDELKNTTKLWDILVEDWGASISTWGTISSMLKFNNYKFPENYQELYDAIREHNGRRHNNTPTIKCPICGSTSVKKIPSGVKWASAVFGNWYDKTSRSQFQCTKCGYMW